jgi:hypothetical protein
MPFFSSQLGSIECKPPAAEPSAYTTGRMSNAVIPFPKARPSVISCDGAATFSNAVMPLYSPALIAYALPKVRAITRRLNRISIFLILSNLDISLSQLYQLSS